MDIVVTVHENTSARTQTHTHTQSVKQPGGGPEACPSVIEISGPPVFRAS